MNIRIVPIDQINIVVYNPQIDLQPGHQNIRNIDLTFEFN